jgi:hypothetical protein
LGNGGVGGAQGLIADLIFAMNSETVNVEFDVSLKRDNESGRKGNYRLVIDYTTDPETDIVTDHETDMDAGQDDVIDGLRAIALEYHSGNSFVKMTFFDDAIPSALADITNALAIKRVVVGGDEYVIDMNNRHWRDKDGNIVGDVRVLSQGTSVQLYGPAENAANTNRGIGEIDRTDRTVFWIQLPAFFSKDYLDRDYEAELVKTANGNYRVVLNLTVEDTDFTDLTDDAVVSSLRDITMEIQGSGTNAQLWTRFTFEDADAASKLFKDGVKHVFLDGVRFTIMPGTIEQNPRTPEVVWLRLRHGTLTGAQEIAFFNTLISKDLSLELAYAKAGSDSSGYRLLINELTDDGLEDYNKWLYSVPEEDERTWQNLNTWVNARPVNIVSHHQNWLANEGAKEFWAWAQETAAEGWAGQYLHNLGRDAWEWWMAIRPINNDYFDAWFAIADNEALLDWIINWEDDDGNKITQNYLDWMSAETLDAWVKQVMGGVFTDEAVRRGWNILNFTAAEWQPWKDTVHNGGLLSLYADEFGDGFISTLAWLTTEGTPEWLSWEDQNRADAWRNLVAEDADGNIPMTWYEYLEWKDKGSNGVMDTETVTGTNREYQWWTTRSGADNDGAEARAFLAYVEWKIAEQYQNP